MQDVWYNAPRATRTRPARNLTCTDIAALGTRDICVPASYWQARGCSASWARPAGLQEAWAHTRDTSRKSRTLAAPPCLRRGAVDVARCAHARPGAVFLRRIDQFMTAKSRVPCRRRRPCSVLQPQCAPPTVCGTMLQLTSVLVLSTVYASGTALLPWPFRLNRYRPSLPDAAVSVHSDAARPDRPGRQRAPTVAEMVAVLVMLQQEFERVGRLLR